MEIEVVALSFGTIILATYAVVNRIKAEIKEAGKKIPNYWYTIMSMAIGAALYGVTYLPLWVTAVVTLGLAASGIFDIRQGNPPE